MPQLTRTRINKPKPKAKTTFLPKSLSFPVLFKKRVKNTRTQAIKSDLAARTLYIVDGDSIIITSLDRKPFCCQDELACMPRPELCRVARELNRKLPRTLRIEPLTYMSEDVMRCKIEEMMGFRQRLSRNHTYRTSTSDSIPTSLVDLELLLSRRSQRNTRSSTSLSSRSSRSSTPYGLDVVEESDEESGWYL